MNTNNFFSSGALQGLASSERFKPLFKNAAETASESPKQNLSSSLGVDINIKALSGKQVFAKSVEFSLGVKLESSYEFKVPSPKDVASTVLGFVENRLNAEKASGASTERLSNLLEQAKAGVEKGYAQARQDIKDLGLMTEELEGEISEGFEMIGKGLTGLEQKFLPDLVAQATDKAAETAPPANTAPPVTAEPSANQAPAQAKNIQVSPDLFRGASPARAEPASVAKSNSSMLVNDISAASADFVLRTREGDEVLIRFADIEQFSAKQTDQGTDLSLSQQSQFQFSVKGDLSEQEIAAINDVLEQVGNISRLFFDEQFEKAFESAMQLGFDTQQIASLSLDLSKTQVQEIRVYEGVAKGALESYKRNQPLINMVQQFERLDSLLSPFERFEQLNTMVDELVEKAIERYSLVRAEQVEDDAKAEKKLSQQVADYQSFSEQVLSSMLESKE